MSGAYSLRKLADVLKGEYENRRLRIVSLFAGREGNV
jgi:hypothetical protein